MSKTHRGTRDLKGQREEVERWLTLGLGVAVGLSGCFVTYFTELVFHEKLHLIAHVFEHNEGQSGGPFHYYTCLAANRCTRVSFCTTLCGDSFAGVKSHLRALKAPFGVVFDQQPYDTTVAHPQQSLNNPARN